MTPAILHSIEPASASIGYVLGLASMLLIWSQTK